MAATGNVTECDQRRRRAYDLAKDHLAIGEQSPHERWELGTYVNQFRALGFFRVGSAVATMGNLPAEVRMVSFADIRPRSPIMLYRVCDPGREQRLSWTVSLRGVFNYAPGGAHGTFHASPHLYSVVAPADSILAVIDNEYIVDPRGLRMTDHGPVKAFTASRLRLGDAVEQFPDLRERLERLGPDFPMMLAPTNVYHLAPGEENSNENTRARPAKARVAAWTALLAFWVDLTRRDR